MRSPQLKPRHCRCARTVWPARTGYFCLSGGGFTFDKYASYRLQLPGLVCRAIIRFLSVMHCPAYAHNPVCKYACMQHVAKHACMPAYVFFATYYIHTRGKHTHTLSHVYIFTTNKTSLSLLCPLSLCALSLSLSLSPAPSPSLAPSLPLSLPLPLTAALRSNTRGSGGQCVAPEPTEQILSQNQTRK